MALRHISMLTAIALCCIDTVAWNTLKQDGYGHFNASYKIIPQLVTTPISLNNITLNNDLDSVDAMPAKEVYILNVENNIRNHPKMQRIIERTITPAVQALYGYDNITACYSLVRRYRQYRTSHDMHYDGHALVTVVVSLSDYGTDYTGGLYVATSRGSARTFLKLNKGDAVIHKSDLLHGVEANGTRWSWIIWYKDSATCQDHSEHWFANCAQNGNPTCQLLHANKMKQQNLAIKWNKEAAKNGHGEARVKMARAYLKRLPSKLPKSIRKARSLFRAAVRDSNEPDAHYGLAELILLRKDQPIEQAVQHLYTAARLGHRFAMFNVGIAETYGFAPKTKHNWFIKSGLPEGFAMAALHANTTAEQHQYKQRAVEIGYGRRDRLYGRVRVGSGGASGTDINLRWPGQIPIL